MYIFREPYDYAFAWRPSFCTYMAWLYDGGYKHYLVLTWGYWNIRLWRIE